MPVISTLLRHLALSTLGAASLAAQVTPIEWPRVEVSIAARHLWVVDSAGDTLHSAPVAVGSGRTLRTAERTWTFRTPRGHSIVRAKEVAPVWIPPEWHYVEIAAAKGLKIGRVFPDSLFTELPASADVIVDGVLYIPPFGTRNRVVSDVLGPYRLLLTNGIGFHGTLDKASIGRAATHGCLRLHDADVTWLYENLPVGTRVVIR